LNVPTGSGREHILLGEATDHLDETTGLEQSVRAQAIADETGVCVL